MKLTTKVVTDYKIVLVLTEGEMRALDALVGYGFKPFIETFYKMGKHYMEPYESDLQNLFEAIEKARPHLHAVDAANKELQILANKTRI